MRVVVGTPSSKAGGPRTSAYRLRRRTLTHDCMRSRLDDGRCRRLESVVDRNLFPPQRPNESRKIGNRQVCNAINLV
jgi:hypothetical protein